MIHMGWLLVSGYVLTAAIDPLAEQQARIETIRKVQPAVVAVFGQSATNGGSGVLISPDGFALTNFHVVSGVGVALKCGLADGQLYDAVLVGVDPVGDVTLIKLLGRTDFPTAQIGDSDRLVLGQPVLAMGNPFLLATDFQPSVSLGIISGLHRYQYPAQSQQCSLLEYTDCIQTDASINPGNSGGPLFDLEGSLVGINGRISLDKRGRVNIGVGYAISINQISNFLEHLKGGMIVDHASLGATVVSANDGRTVVNEILRDSDAYRQGLRVGDEIVSFGDRRIGSPNQFLNVLGILPKGWRTTLTYRRDQKQHEIRPRLLGKHREMQLEKLFEAEADPKLGPMMEKPKLPDVVAAVYESRTGFANYYFNRQRRDELLKLIDEGFAERPNPWKLHIREDSAEAVITIANGQAQWQSGDTTIVAPSEENDEADPSIMAMLLALEEWRRLLQNGDQWFTECHFAGGHREQQTVQPALRTVRAGIQTLWVFDPQAGTLTDMVREPVGTWIRVGMADYRPTDLGELPHRFIVELSGGSTRELTVTSWEYTP